VHLYGTTHVHVSAKFHACVILGAHSSAPGEHGGAPFPDLEKPTLLSYMGS